MFIRKTSSKNSDGSHVRYLQLAESVYDKEARRPRNIVVHSFGRETPETRAALVRLKASIDRYLDTPPPIAPGQKSLPEFDEIKEYGTVALIKGLWEELGLAQHLEGFLKAEQCDRPLLVALFVMLANRLAAPTSKLDCFENWLPRIYAPEAADVTLGHLYQGLDFLHRHASDVERFVFQTTADLLNADVDLIFFDTTSFFFEISEEDEPSAGRGPRPSALRRRGHSKEGRDHDPQVVVGLALTRDGLPVRSWVWPGNTSDMTTLQEISKDLGGWRLNKSVLVTDAGMFSGDNQAAVVQHIGRYIQAVPLRKIKRASDVIVRRPGRFRKVGDNLWVKEVSLEGDPRRYVLCFNPREARREQRNRDRILKKLVPMVRQQSEPGHTKAICSLLSSKRYGRYLSLGPEDIVFIDAQKVARDKRLDGRFIVMTNDGDLSAEDIALGYKSMALIEGCFRRMKTTGLKTRPVFHWTPRRIEAHIKLCVLALTIQRMAEIRAGLPWRRIRRELDQIKVVTYRCEGRRVTQSMRPTPEGREAFRQITKNEWHDVIRIQKEILNGI